VQREYKKLWKKARLGRPSKKQKDQRGDQDREGLGGRTPDVEACGVLKVSSWSSGETLRGKGGQDLTVLGIK